MEKNFELEALLERVKNVERNLGPFVAKYDEELNLIIEAESGWMTKYPFGSETWIILTSWIDEWDESAKVSVENFIKACVFPTSVRLYGIDEKYIRDICNAHIELNARIDLGEHGSPENDGEIDDFVNQEQGSDE